jgi:hypothetical protein
MKNKQKNCDCKKDNPQQNLPVSAFFLSAIAGQSFTLLYIFAICHQITPEKLIASPKADLRRTQLRACGPIYPLQEAVQGLHWQQHYVYSDKTQQVR